VASLSQATFLADQFKELCSQKSNQHESLKKHGSQLNQDVFLFSSFVSRRCADGIYSLPVFTEEFSARLIAELKHFEASPLPKGRPNTMNHYGVMFY
jgi:hypothetical protein